MNIPGSRAPSPMKGGFGRPSDSRGIAIGVPLRKALDVWAFVSMSTKKQPEIVRRVWRMTAEAPAGEYLDLELVPKETSAKGSAEAAPRRTFHPETPPAYRTVSVASASGDVSARVPNTQMSAPTDGSSSMTVRHSPPTRESAAVDLPLPSGARAKVLRPAQVESWQESSFDLLTGCVVRDVTDTIPGKIYDELFGPGERIPPGPRQRR